MSTKNVPSGPIINKVIERVKGQDVRNNPVVTDAKWLARGGLFGGVNQQVDDQQPPEEAPAASVSNR